MPGFSPFSLLRAVWKNKLLGGSVALLVAAAGVAITFRLPAIYQADALILVDPQKIPERFVASTVNTDVQDRLATINQEIQSSTRLQKIIDEFNLYPQQRLTHTPEEVIAIMRRDIQTILERGVGGNRPGAFRIIYQGRDPDVVAKVVERITQFYIDENLRTRELQAQGTYSFMESKLRDAKKELDEQELALTRYKLEHNGQLPQQENSLNAALSRLQVELQGNQDATNRAQQNKLVLENTLAAAQDVESTLAKQAKEMMAAAEKPDEVPVPDPNVPKPHRPSDDVEAQLKSLQLRYTDQHPEVRRLRALLTAMRAEERQEDLAAKAAARRLVASKTGSGEGKDEKFEPLVPERAQAHERVVGLKAQLAANARELQARATERERILSEMGTYQRRIDELPVRDLEMSALTRNFDFSRNYYNSMLSKETEAEIATDLEKRQKAETFRVLDPPQRPQKPIKPKREVLCAMSVIFGIVLGLITAIGREMQAGVILGEWELPAGVTILGRVCRIQPAVTTLVEDHDQIKPGKKEPLSSFERGGVPLTRYMVVESKLSNSSGD